MGSSGSSSSSGKAKAPRVSSTKGKHIVHVNPLQKGAACLACKARKIRCDGAFPCYGCKRTANFKGQDLSECNCVYGQPKTRRAPRNKAARGTSPSSADLVAQFDELDWVVAGKLQALAQGSNTVASTSARLFPSTFVEDDGLSYFSDASSCRSSSVDSYFSDTDASAASSPVPEPTLDLQPLQIPSLQIPVLDIPRLELPPIKVPPLELPEVAATGADAGFSLAQFSAFLTASPMGTPTLFAPLSTARLLTPSQNPFDFAFDHAAALQMFPAAMEAPGMALSIESLWPQEWAKSPIWIQ